MEQNFETKLDFKARFINLFTSNKKKIFFLIFFIIMIFVSLIFLNSYKDKKNDIISEKYIKAGLYLNSKNNEEAINIFNEIILSKNKFYSILALNTIIEKDLIKDEKKIFEYFEILENLNLTSENRDLIIFKKALYLIKNNKGEEGKKLLKKLDNKTSTLRNLAQEILKD
tara:strand:+ start:3402 stop:3911 length:510 start_codon:yes stop_codon:yes gene_type:complete